MVREMNEHRELIEKYLLGWGVFFDKFKVRGILYNNVFV